jgi:hypothetical protein
VKKNLCIKRGRPFSEKQPLNVSLNCKISKDDKRDLNNIAVSLNISESAVVRIMIRDFSTRNIELANGDLI